MGRTRRLSLIPLCVLVLLVPAGDAAGQSCDLGTMTATGFNYRLCGGRPVDLDQIRPHVVFPNGSELGVAGDGVNFCFPTSVMDHFAWLADQGLITRPPDRDWESNVYFDEMSGYLRDLGARMGTTSGGGTTRDPTAGIRSWLNEFGNARSELRGSDVVTRFYGIGQHRGRPDLRAMVRSALAGHLVSVGLGYYQLQQASGAIADERLKRVGGHVVSLVSAVGPSTLQGVAANLGVSDPGTPSNRDSIQSYFREDVLYLEEASRQGFINDDDETYDATLHRLRGSNTYFDSWYSLAPKTLVYTPLKADTIALRDSLSLVRGAGVQRIGAPGAAVDAEILPHDPLVAIAYDGGSDVYLADRLTGETSAVIDTGLGEVRDVAFGGDAGHIFASDGRRIAMFDTSGQKLDTVKLGSSIKELEYDIAGDRLVGLAPGSRQLLFFGEDLSKQGSASLPKRALDGRGSLSLAFAADGTALIRRDGGDDLAKARFGGTKGRPIARVAKVTEDELRLSDRSKGLAVDDAGHLFVSDKGEIVEFTPSGKRVKGSRFAGVKAGLVLTVARSYTNHDPSFIPSLDFVPEQYEPTWDGQPAFDEKG